MSRSDRWKKQRHNAVARTNERIKHLLSQFTAPEQQHEMQLWRHWDMVMGSDLAELAFPLGSRHDILIIGGEDNLALQDLAFMTPEILERANAFMGSPTFVRVELRLLQGRRTLNLPPAIQPAVRERLPLQRPERLGHYLDQMDPESPVARCYRAYLKTFGVEPLP